MRGAVRTGEQTMLVLPLSPPKRLAPGARFRSLKNQADRDVWRQAWQRVEALQAEGWQVARVAVDVGRTMPLLPGAVPAWLRALCALPDDVPVDCAWSGRGNGETRVYLQRDE